MSILRAVMQRSWKDAWTISNALMESGAGSGLNSETSIRYVSPFTQIYASLGESKPTSFFTSFALFLKDGRNMKVLSTFRERLLVTTASLPHVAIALLLSRQDTSMLVS